MSLNSVIAALNPIDKIKDMAVDLIRTFKLPPEKALEAEIAFKQLEITSEASKREAAYNMESLLVEEQKALRDQIKIEIESEDPYVRRQRPSWGYGLLIVYVLNYGGASIINFFTPTAPIEFDVYVHLLSAFLVGGIALLRTIEKVKGVAS